MFLKPSLTPLTQSKQLIKMPPLKALMVVPCWWQSFGSLQVKPEVCSLEFARVGQNHTYTHLYIFYISLRIEHCTVHDRAYGNFSVYTAKTRTYVWFWPALRIAYVDCGLPNSWHGTSSSEVDIRTLALFTVLLWHPLRISSSWTRRSLHFYSILTPFCIYQGWVIRRRRIIRRIVFITYLTVFFKLLRIIRFWALNKCCSHKPPRAPQKHSQAL